MKISTFKILSLVVCVMMMFSSIIAVERFHRGHSLRQFRLTTNNPFAKFAEGILVGAIGGDNSWMNCLPQEWRTEGQAEEDGNFMGEQFNSMNSTGQNLIKIIDRIVGMLCNYKDQLASILNTVFKTGGRFFMEGKFGAQRRTRKWFMNRLKAAAGAVGNAAKRGANAVGGAVRSAGNVVKNVAVSAYQGLKAAAQAVMAKASEWFVKVRNFFRNIFSSKNINLIKKFFACLMSGKQTAMRIKELVMGLKDKITMFSTGNTADYIKFVINLVCNKEAFIGVVNSIAAGIRENNKGSKFLYFGKAIGQALQYVVSSRRRYK